MEGMAMTAELAVKPPSYEEWLEWQWNDSSWYEWILASEFEHGKTLGIWAPVKDISFDLYYSRCAGNGELADAQLFVKTFHDRLYAVSPVLAEMLGENLITFRWQTTRNSNLQIVGYDDSAFWDEDYIFTEGFFKGLSVQELYDAEPSGTSEKFEDELLDIIKDYYEDILKVLLTEDETRTSTEEYEDWIKNCWIP